MKIQVKNILNVNGNAIEPNWRYAVQIVSTTTGDIYLNTPEVSGDIFREDEVVKVGIGNMFGKTGKEYRTITKR